MAAQQGSRLFGMTLNPIPHGVVSGFFNAREGHAIRYARWEPSGAGRLGTVCLFSGRGEFIEKYFETITDLRRRGFAVATMDWRGEGGSSRLLSNPAKGHIDSFNKYDDDVSRFMTQIVLPDCPPPYYCLGHSMGAHIALRLANMKLCWWDRMVLISPMIQLFGTPSRAALRCTAAQTLKLFGLSRLFIPGGSGEIKGRNSFETNVVTSYRMRYERSQDILTAAPQLGIGSPTIGWAAAACASIRQLNSPDFIERIKVPILIVAAGNDQIVSTNATEQFARQLKTCKRIVIAGARHEILQERDEFREQFWAAFDAYVPGVKLMTQMATLHV